MILYQHILLDNKYLNYHNNLQLSNVLSYVLLFNTTLCNIFYSSSIKNNIYYFILLNNVIKNYNISSFVYCTDINELYNLNSMTIYNSDDIIKQ